MFATFRRVVDEEGFDALYAGLAPRMFFAAALLAIEFAIFEALRDAFHVSRDDFAYALDALARPCGRRRPRPRCLIRRRRPRRRWTSSGAYNLDILIGSWDADRATSDHPSKTRRPAPLPGRVAGASDVSSRAARPIATAARWHVGARAALRTTPSTRTGSQKGKGQHAHAVEASKGQRKHA